MKKSYVLALAVALMAACGSPTPGSNDTSVERDAALQSDTSPTVDAAVDNDTPAPEDTPIATNETGVMAENCWSQACGMQDVYSMDGSHRDGVNFYCDMTTRRIGLTPAGLSCEAECNGDVCTCVLEDANGLSVRAENVRENGHCGAMSRFTYFRDGQQMTLSSGVERLVKR